MTSQPSPIDPENLWDQLLSRQEALIRAVFASLTLEEQHVVIAHLTRMVEETGWHTEQRRSAKLALQALGKDLPSN
jgi:hypothetical protein